MIHRTTIALAFTALALGLSTPLAAQTVYKLIAKDGKVTYGDKPPKEFDGQVIRIDIDPNANRAKLPNPNEPSALSKPTPMSMQEARRFDTALALARAREALEKAKKDLADGQEPKEGEVDWIGKVGGGARPVPTDAYNARIANLEISVKSAEAELARAEKANRQAALD
jgi:Domain of unknown function (DUF4124)